MAQTISIGKQDFLYLRENNYFYIDKTDFIRQWWESADDITLITRPRRFGKTLNMSMLNYFSQIIIRKKVRFLRSFLYGTAKNTAGYREHILLYL